jgi:glutaredoxin 2
MIPKLYMYEHCPYCIRVLTGFRLKGLAVEVIHLDNDDEDTPRRMVGRKIVPILEDADGFTVESLDILRKIDTLSEPRLFERAPNSETTEWIERWKPTLYGLVLPRVADTVFPEFRRPEARVAFRKKKEASYGSFDLLLARTDELKAEMELGLGYLVPILPPEGLPGIDDVLLFPFLRSLSIVPGLALPDCVAAYCDRTRRLTGIGMIAPPT